MLHWKILNLPESKQNNLGSGHFLLQGASALLSSFLNLKDFEYSYKIACINWLCLLYFADY